MGSERRVVCAAIRAADGELLLGIRHYSKDMRAARRLDEPTGSLRGRQGSRTADQRFRLSPEHRRWDETSQRRDLLTYGSH